jgi:hypothetical protein
MVDQPHTIVRKLAEVCGTTLTLAATSTGHVILSSRRGEPAEVLYVLGWAVDVADA